MFIYIIYKAFLCQQSYKCLQILPGVFYICLEMKNKNNPQTQVLKKDWYWNCCPTFPLCLGAMEYSKYGFKRPDNSAINIRFTYYGTFGGEVEFSCPATQ